jgi:hypothetical protein
LAVVPPLTSTQRPDGLPTIMTLLWPPPGRRYRPNSAMAGAARELVIRSRIRLVDTGDARRISRLWPMTGSAAIWVQALPFQESTANDLTRWPIFIKSSHAASLWSVWRSRRRQAGPAHRTDDQMRGSVADNGGGPRIVRARERWSGPHLVRQNEAVGPTGAKRRIHNDACQY